MKATNLITLATLAVLALNVSAKDFSPEELQRRTLERRAVDAVIWGAPVVTLDMMRQAYFRDAKASYNDIVWWPKGAGWQNQSLDALQVQSGWFARPLHPERESRGGQGAKLASCAEGPVSTSPCAYTRPRRIVLVGKWNPPPVMRAQALPVLTTQ
jgi:hypothetical protein